MACHIMDGPYWALKLGAPSTVELVKSTKVMPEMAPWASVIQFQFPARGDLPPCSLTWYDGGQKPPKPPEMEAAKLDDNGALLIGDKGKIVTTAYGEKPQLLPESRMAGYKWPAEIIPRVPGQQPAQGFYPGLQGRPGRVLQFRRFRPVHRNGLAGQCGIAPGP
jgi:hypothetical protein